MQSLREHRNVVAAGLAFPIIAVLYVIGAPILGYRIEWAGATMLTALGVAMGLMFYVLTAGSPKD
jgi:hypothetical protein